MKTSAERGIEALTWAMVIMWIGFSLVVLRPIQNYVWMVLMVLGIIFLSSAIYQRSRGWQTSLTIWLAGVWMAVFSVIEVVDEMVEAIGGSGLNIDLWVYLGIALISMGLAVIMRSMHFPGLSGGGTASRRGEVDMERYQRPSAIPRQAQDDFSSGWTPPVQSGSSVDPLPRGRTGRQRASRSRALPPTPQQPPASQPSDLENRVEDIIRRSRERRDRNNLPY